MFVERDAAFRATFQSVLDEARGAGEVDPDVDPAAAAAIVVGTLRGVAMQWQVASTLLSLTVVRRTVRRLLETGLAPAGDRD